MRSTFGGLEISKRSLFAQQAALTTTGHNIANANTRGYTRQVVNLVASRPIEVPGLMRSNIPGQMGQGVEFDYIKRIRESFLDHQFHNEQKNLGSWTVRKDTLEKLEAIFNEPSDTGVRQVIENFWNSWQVLSKEPENLTARAALKESAIAMTDAFNHTSRQLSDLSDDITENIDVKVKEINSFTDQIARLNNEIFRIEGLGNDANDLRDQRDLLADDLSKIINITVRETENGYDIQMGATSLVNGIQASTVSAESLQGAVGSGDLNSGEVHGMLISRDEYLKLYKFQINAMVKSLVEGDVSVTLPKGTVVPTGTTLGDKTWTGTIADRTVTDENGITVTVKGLNGLHKLGYSIDNPPKSGMPFFTIAEGAAEFNADSIRVNPDIVNKVANIAASSRVELGTDGKEQVIKGNNDIALALAGLRNKKFNFEPSADGMPLLNYGSFDEFFRAVVGQLGVQSQEAKRQATNQQVLVDQVDARRQSVSGVSLDEEMANMIKYQHAYNAAARAMTTFDEMLDKIINSMGVVGR
jgi:flagellar hook-associated protein 1